jgi:hypothetical protein
MNELLSKAKIDKPRLKSYLTQRVAHELSALSEPCYYPSLKKDYFEMLGMCELTDRDIKNHVKKFYAGNKAAKFLLQQDAQRNFLIFMMYYFLRQRDASSFVTTMVYTTIREYTNYMSSNLQYCNPAIFSASLDRIARTHLFAREKTIPNALYYLAQELTKRYTSLISEPTADGVAKFITESRHRVAQSVRGFLRTYYDLSKSGIGYRSPQETESGDEYQYDSMEKGERLVGDITKKITVYREIDRKAIDDSRKLTKISTSLATLLINELSDVKYSDSVKGVLSFFIKDLKNVKAICGTAYFTYVRDLMATKRTNKTIYFKQQVGELLDKLLTEIGYKNRFNRLSSQTQFLISLFLAYYITMVMRNSIC